MQRACDYNKSTEFIYKLKYADLLIVRKYNGDNSCFISIGIGDVYLEKRSIVAKIRF